MNGDIMQRIRENQARDRAAQSHWYRFLSRHFDYLESGPPLYIWLPTAFAGIINALAIATFLSMWAALMVWLAVKIIGCQR